MTTLYHVTPHATWLKHIRKEGLVPQRQKRGIFADSQEPRIYLFEDFDTAYDGLANWLLDEFPDNIRYFAFLEVMVPDDEVMPDPEIAGSFYVTQAIPPEYIRLAKKVDVGEE
jgi:hypothetical protein